MPTVLVVDDSEVDRRLAGNWVENAVGATVVYAADGNDAISQIQQDRPDVVVTDLQMPQMDGLQLLTAIKQDFPLIPVILMTAMGSEEIASEALRRGAASYVTKRRLAEDLPATVQQVLSAAGKDRLHSRLMHHLDSNQSTYILHNDLDLIRALVSHLQQMLRCLPLGDETERLRAGIALEEALKNAYYHGNLEVGATVGNVDQQAYAELVKQRCFESPYRERRIHVNVRINREQAEFTIRDEGPGFDVSRLPQLVEDSSAHDASGRGTILMRTIMDEVSFNEAGNQVTMIKRRVQEDFEEDEELDDEP